MSFSLICLFFKPLFSFSLIKLFLILSDDIAIVKFWFIGGIEKEEETFSGKGKKKKGTKKKHSDLSV